MPAVLVQDEVEPVDQRPHQEQPAARVGRGGLALGFDELRTTVASGPVEPQALLDAVLGGLNPPRTDDVTLLCLART